MQPEISTDPTWNERSIEGQISLEEQERWLNYVNYRDRLQSALDADLIDGFEMMPFDPASDNAGALVKYKPQLTEFKIQATK